MINSVSGYGSTGTICEEIATELQRQGHQCFIAYGQLSTTYANSFKIGTKIENHLHNLLSRITGKQGYFTKRGTKKLINYIQQIQPEIIHLHNLHGNYLHLPLLFDFLHKNTIPVVYTLHDCWAFTGKCSHYTDVQCYKWKSSCHHCPQIQQYPPSVFLDFSKTMYQDKKNWLLSLPKLQIITVSHWLQEQVKQSFLQNIETKCIYNWVDSAVYKPYFSEETIQNFTIDTSRFTILLVSAYWNTKDSKWKDLLRLAKELEEESVQLVVVGNIEDTTKFPKNAISIPYVKNREILAELYSFSDVYVHLSTEDTFGKVIAEALSCGTPAIVYDSTACPEIIGPNCGYVVARNDVKSIHDKIRMLQQQNMGKYQVACREFVIANFNMQENIEQTIQLYQKTLV